MNTYGQSNRPSKNLLFDQIVTERNFRALLFILIYYISYLFSKYRFIKLEIFSTNFIIITQ